MINDEDKMDEYGRRVLAPLRPAPPLDPLLAAPVKEKFLQQAKTYREELTMQSTMEGGDRTSVTQPTRTRRSFQWTKALVGAFFALIILFGSGATVYAAQSSLPGEPLYFVKSLTEDIRLKLSGSPQTKLDLTLKFTNRRVDEISSLVSEGKALPAETSDRFKGELETALQLASKMEDKKMKEALGRIRHLAESQGITIEELINMLPDQKDPAIARLQLRLQEQIELSKFGEKDPQAFRSAVRERELRLHGKQKLTPGADVTKTSKPETSETQEKPDKGNDKSSDAPGHDDSNPGKDNPNPGSENRNKGTPEAP